MCISVAHGSVIGQPLFIRFEGDVANDIKKLFFAARHTPSQFTHHHHKQPSDEFGPLLSSLGLALPSPCRNNGANLFFNLVCPTVHFPWRNYYFFVVHLFGSNTGHH